MKEKPAPIGARKSHRHSQQRGSGRGLAIAVVPIDTHPVAAARRAREAGACDGAARPGVVRDTGALPARVGDHGEAPGNPAPNFARPSSFAGCGRVEQKLCPNCSKIL